MSGSDGTGFFEFVTCYDVLLRHFPMTHVAPASVNSLWVLSFAQNVTILAHTHTLQCVSDIPDTFAFPTIYSPHPTRFPFINKLSQCLVARLIKHDISRYEYGSLEFVTFLTFLWSELQLAGCAEEINISDYVT